MSSSIAFEGWRGFRGWNQDDRDLVLTNLNVGAQLRERIRNGYRVMGKALPAELEASAAQDADIMREYASPKPTPQEFFTPEMLRASWAPGIEPRRAPEIAGAPAAGVQNAAYSDSSPPPQAQASVPPVEGFDDSSIKTPFASGSDDEKRYRHAVIALREQGYMTLPESPFTLFNMYRNTFPQEVRNAWSKVEGENWPTGQVLNELGTARGNFERKELEYKDLLANRPSWLQLPPWPGLPDEFKKRRPWSWIIDPLGEVGTTVTQEYLDERKETYEERLKRVEAERGALKAIFDAALVKKEEKMKE